MSDGDPSGGPGGGGPPRPADSVRRYSERIAGVGSWEWDAQSGTMTWSDQLFRLIGADPAVVEPSFDLFLESVHPDDRAHFAAIAGKAAMTGKPYAADHRLVDGRGRVREVHNSGVAERDPAGHVRRLIGSVHDVTETRTAIRDLHRTRDLFESVLDAAADNVIIGTDAAGTITEFNSGAEATLGVEAGNPVGGPFDALFAAPPDVWDSSEPAETATPVVSVSAFQALALTAHGGVQRRWSWSTPAGRRLTILATATCTRGAAGETTGFVLVGTEITARLKTASDLEASESLFQDVFEHAPCGISVARAGSPAAGRLVRVNRAMSEITGYSRADLLTMSLSDLTHPAERRSHADRFTALRADRTSYAAVDRRWITADGREICVEVSITAMSSDRSGYVVAMVEDVTARKRAEARLSELDLHDPLTGLPNRLLLLDRIDQALLEAEAAARNVAVLYVDLDEFKAFNNAAGHLAGDQLLTRVAERIRRLVPPGHTVSRIGGDEFVIVCPGVNDVAAVQATAQSILLAIAEPFPEVGGYRISASIGVGVSAPGQTAAELLKCADDAMYAAKDDGKNQVRAAHRADGRALTRTTRAARHQRIETELAFALTRDELVMWGQPVLNLRTGAVIAVETLLRWNHVTRGLLIPAEFLDVAETSDLMKPIGRRVLFESTRIAANWERPDGCAPPVVFVNISGRQLETASLRGDVLNALDAAGLPAHRLVLELTETFTPLITGGLLKDLDDLRSRGVRIAIDDVGTGYSSLTRLTELPVDILKIDRSFTACIGAKAACEAVVKAIISIGRSLHLQVVAEGVETVEQAEALAEFGCDTVQGFLFGRPSPEDELGRLVNRADLYPRRPPVIPASRTPPSERASVDRVR